MDLETGVTSKSEYLLDSLANYNSFASHYQCATGLDPFLYWEAEMSVRLKDDIILKVTGLNSAFLCDATDQPGPTVMIGQQQRMIRRETNVVQIVMCHHPENWLVDGGLLLTTLRNRAELALFGHEHNANVKNLDGLLVLHAGAVNPESIEHATASYNVVSINVNEDRRLHIQVRRRNYDHEQQCFVAHYFAGGIETYTHEQVLPPLPSTYRPAVQPTTNPQLGGEPNLVTQPSISEETIVRRLTFYLFALAEGARIGAVRDLNLLTPQTEQLSGNELFLAIIDEARSRGILTELWREVALRSPNMPKEPTSGVAHA